MLQKEQKKIDPKVDFFYGLNQITLQRELQFLR
jgi:hypothetical protein